MTPEQEAELIEARRFSLLVRWNKMVAELAPDHKPDGSGLDDGVYLPGCAPRKKHAPKPMEVISEIRARAWMTRRNRYGDRGHS
jgi:hypothetical protein